MGVATSLYDRLRCGRDKEVRILLAGLDGAGKTTLLYKLKTGDVVPTIPSISFNLETVTYKNIAFRIWDIGGGDKIRHHLWRQHFENIDGIIYVVDSNKREWHEEAVYELHNIVLMGYEVKDCVLLVFANKQDLPNAMSTNELTDKLKLNTIKGRSWHIQAVSVIQGDGLQEGLDWLSNALSQK